MSSDHDLRGHGLKVTAARQAVLTAVAQRPHASTVEIAELLVDGPILSKQGLYNILDALTRARLLRRIEPAGSSARYELRVGDNHHHVVCRICGRVADVDCARGEAPCLEPNDTRGFRIDEAEVTWWGVCAACHDARGAIGDRKEHDPFEQGDDHD